MFAVQTIRRLEALQALVPEWSELCRSDPQATPFQTPEWALAWWRHLGSGSLHCLALRHESRLVGLAPLYVSRRQFPPLRRLAFLGTGNSDYLDLIIAPTSPEPGKAISDHSEGRLAVETVTHLRRQMREAQSDWDYLDLQQLRCGASALALPQAGSPLMSEHAHSTCPYLPLAGPDGMDGVPSRLRKNLRYAHRRLSHSGEVRFRVASSPTLDRDLDSLFRLHNARWRSRGLPGIFNNARVQAFHREVAAAFLENGILRLHVLERDSTTLATTLCYVMSGRVFYYGGGFDPDWANYSPGSLVIGEAIRSAAAEGCVEFDFLRGEEAYKRLWGCLNRRNHRLVASASKVAARITGSLPEFEASLERVGLRALERYIHRRR